MPQSNALNLINRWTRRWITYRLLTCIFMAAAIGLFTAGIAHFVPGFSALWATCLFTGALLLLLVLNRPWKLNAHDLCRFLNAEYPELEESCELIVAQNSGSLLANLQRAKVETAIMGLELPARLNAKPKVWGGIVILALFFMVMVNKIDYKWSPQMLNNIFDGKTAPAKNTAPEVVPGAIESVLVTVIPPAYTHHSSVTQNKFTLNIEEGAQVKWTIRTNKPVKELEFIFNEHETLRLQSNTGRTEWTASKQIGATGFYQVKIEGKLSDYYQIGVIKDNPPVIRIKTPKQYTYIDAGESAKVPLSVTVNDDYGISNAFIFATVAKGSGESVKFKEQKLDFSESFAAEAPQYNLQKTLDLHSLNMEPGDELYFYVQATDNHQQSTRTDIYIVSIQDTAELLSMDNMTRGVSLVPEYFRSERQIIIDSEKLLKDKDSISVDVFKTRSNDLGIDQKLLRLRYGKFLGEESESGDQAAAGREELGNPADFSNAQKILDVYSDKHDNAEDAGFFEKNTKDQLKATLTEMWKAELHLRIYKPDEALPFEYKALRLLKDLQQKSRAYVPKTAYNPPPLKVAEKRLSGDLSKIGQPLTQRDIKPAAGDVETLKKAVSVLEQLKQNPNPGNGDITVLQQAAGKLSALAVSQPKAYLAGVAALHHLVLAAHPTGIKQTDISTAENALQKALPNPPKLPQVIQNMNDMGLSQQYFKNLKR